jgi:DNA-binding NarL/FixJ family response regulator
MARAGLREDQIAVVIVDDHPLFRAGIRDRVQSGDDSIVVVGEAVSGEDSFSQIRALAPDVVLMDIAMKGMNGIEATKIITDTFPDVEVIILSVYDDDQYVRAALEAGASGYLLKTVEASELRESIIRVAAGGSALSPSIARIVLDQAAGNQPGNNRLSERERQVLELAARGLSNKDIAKDLFVSVRTVEAHMRKIFEKMGVLSRTEAVTHAVQLRWIRLPDAP